MTDRLDFPSDVAALALLSMPDWSAGTYDPAKRCEHRLTLGWCEVRCGALEGHVSAGWHAVWNATQFHAWLESQVDEA